MITIHSINLKEVTDPCFATIGYKESSGCRVLIRMHEGCGSYRCPFYKPRDCRDWVRIEDKMGVNLIPPEDLGGKHEQTLQK